MSGEIDEAWIEEAIERYQRMESLIAEFDKAVTGVEVTVHSPDGLVEVAVAADGAIRGVVIAESARSRSMRELSRSVQAAVAAAVDAAGWARSRLHQETFGEFHPISTERRGSR